MHNPLSGSPIFLGKKLLEKSYPLHIHISVLFTFLFLVYGLSSIYTSYHLARNMLTDSTLQRFNSLGDNVSAGFERIQLPVLDFVSILSKSALMDAETTEERLAFLPIFRQAMKRNEALMVIYVGYANGDTFFLQNLKNQEDIDIFKSPPQAAFLVQSLIRKGEKNVGEYLFLDKKFNLIEKRRVNDDPFSTYDPRTRPWYKMAADKENPVEVAPYVFFISSLIGKTIAQQASDKKAVAAADIRLDKVTSILSSLKPTALTQIILFQDDGMTISDSETNDIFKKDSQGKTVLKHLEDINNPLVNAMSKVFKEGRLNEPVKLQVDGKEWLLLIKQINESNGWNMAVMAPSSELMAMAEAQLHWSVMIAVVIMGLALPLTWFLSHRVSRDLRTLTGLAKSIRRFNFSGETHVSTMIKEVQELSNDLTHTRLTIRHFLDVASVLSSERNLTTLLEKILLENLQSIGAQAGVIYLTSDDGLILEPATALYIPSPLIKRSLQPETGERVQGLLEELESIVIKEETRPEITDALRENRTIVRHLTADKLPCTKFREAWGAKEGQIVSVPLKNRDGANVGLITLYRREEVDQKLDKDMASFIEQLSGVAAVTIENHRLFQAQQNLLKALIKLIAGAIDAKSPYTGGHCQRVPVITKMLAQAACDAKEGPFADYGLSEDDWETLYVAAWLHDCGKVTTPEYVVDKATKLETIYDRIHEIRLRFEILKRDAKIDYLEALAKGEDPNEARACLEKAWQRLDDEFAFVAGCNKGEEKMDPAKLERLKEIAAHTWLRTISDRLGISREEEQRLKNVPEAPLPVKEFLLSDKPEHLVEYQLREMVPPDNRWGFKVKMPQYRFNRGELTNLSIPRGTLTEEERYIINHHIMQTIMMLSELPLPGRFSRVPEIAGGHHERMDGHGYPKGLTGAEMSTEAKMMAIADVFEALTAKDRPYKPSKTLSESLGIMANMVRNGHLDADLFELFLKSGIYKTYAENYLDPGQIDEVDLSSLLKKP